MLSEEEIVAFEAGRFDRIKKNSSYYNIWLSPLPERKLPEDQSFSPLDGLMNSQSAWHWKGHVLKTGTFRCGIRHTATESVSTKDYPLVWEPLPTRVGISINTVL